MKLLPRLNKFKKKRQEHLQEKERTDARDITEHSSQESLQCIDENVDFKNTTDDFFENFKELIEGYENDEGEFIDMSQRRDALYHSKMEWNSDTQKFEIVETKRLGKDVHLTSAANHQDNVKNESFDPYSYRSMPTEVRGITLRQLRAIIPLIKRRCEKEQWTRPVYKDRKKTKKKEKVTFENATLYDINKYIIKPFTESSKKSFVETMPSTKGTQPPRWFVSHYWGESFVHTIACLEQMVKDFEVNEEEEHDKRGGGMTEDTPVWICSFANNQHNLESEITANPADSAFAKAMKIAKFRVISILDVNSQVYTRLWCMYELYLTLFLSGKQGINGVLAIYTYHEHEIDYAGTFKAVGLVEGGVLINDWDDWVYYERQKHFPRERLLPFLTVSIQDAEASEDKDRKHILNSLAEEDLDAELLKHHDNYDILNDAIRGAVFSSQATLKLVYETGEANWKNALSALEKSTLKDFRFDLDSNGKPLFTKEVMAQVCHHLPIGLEKLEIIRIPHGRAAMDALLDWLENKSTNLKFLKIWGTCIGGEVGGKECGERLARFLARDDCKIGEIELIYTDLLGSRNVDTWIECLEKNQSLKEVNLFGIADCVEEFVRESVKPNTSIIPYDYYGGTIYWDGTTFPDATQSIEQEKALVKTVSTMRFYSNGFVLGKETAEQNGTVSVDNEVDMTSNWLCGVNSCF